MNIMGFLDDQAVTTDLRAQSNKEEVIRELVQLLINAGSIKDKDANNDLLIFLVSEIHICVFLIQFFVAGLL